MKRIFHFSLLIVTIVAMTAIAFGSTATAPGNTAATVQSATTLNNTPATFAAMGIGTIRSNPALAVNLSQNTALVPALVTASTALQPYNLQARAISPPATMAILKKPAEVHNNK